MAAGLMRVQARHTLLALPAALVLLLLVSAQTAAADRGDAFPGYKEEGAPAECKNQLADEYCEASGGGGGAREAGAGVAPAQCGPPYNIHQQSSSALRAELGMPCGTQAAAAGGARTSWFILGCGQTIAACCVGCSRWQPDRLRPPAGHSLPSCRTTRKHQCAAQVRVLAQGPLHGGTGMLLRGECGWAAAAAPRPAPYVCSSCIRRT